MAKNCKGPAYYCSQKGDKGMPKGGLPKVSEKKAGPIVWTGQGGNKGIPKKASGGGKGSDWAATHD